MRTRDLFLIGGCLLAACSSRPPPKPAPAVRVEVVGSGKAMGSPDTYSAVAQAKATVPLAFRGPGYVLELMQVKTADGRTRAVGDGDRESHRRATDPPAPPVQILATLACDLGLRPAGAPGFADLAGAVRAVRREGPELLVEYDPSAAESVAALAAAERRCCRTIGWEAVGATLRVRAQPDQLDAIEQLVRLA